MKEFLLRVKKILNANDARITFFDVVDEYTDEYEIGIASKGYEMDLLWRDDASHYGFFRDLKETVDDMYGNEKAVFQNLATVLEKELA